MVTPTEPVKNVNARLAAPSTAPAFYNLVFDHISHAKNPLKPLVNELEGAGRRLFIACWRVFSSASISGSVGISVVVAQTGGADIIDAGRAPTAHEPGKTSGTRGLSTCILPDMATLVDAR